MRYWFGIFLLISSMTVQSEPFDNCPTEAFLMQGKPATLYGVNLYSGSYRELAGELGTSGTINGFGFNFFDNYLYGWGAEAGTLVKIGQDYQIQPLIMNGTPDIGFYVGDVSITSNYYYFYRPGAKYGLFKVALDPDANDYLNVVQVVNGSDMNLSIYDFAFHPYQDLAYTVDRNGRLIKIDVSTGEYEVLGNTGYSGTFGAVYFDVDAYLYFSRNSDGHIFRVDIGNGETTGSFYTFGPSSNNNDGARCALAEIYDPDLPPTVDMGDAPESFEKLTLGGEVNHAKHALGSLYLGSNIDAEYTPREDDSDDGVQFVTTLEIGLDALMRIESSASGYVSVWFDWDQNNHFSEDEKVVSGEAVNAGFNNLIYNVPFDVNPGQIWARVRLAQLEDIGPTGGAGVGEVSDYQLEVLDTGVARIDSGWATVAFEDRWPEVGDYDFNDVVVRYKVKSYSKNGLLQRMAIEGRLQAVGADYRNGFAIRLPGIDSASIEPSLTRFEINGQSQVGSPVENRADMQGTLTSDVVVIPFANTKAFYQATNKCKFFRTEAGCERVAMPTFALSLTFSSAIPMAQVPAGHMDPFIFAVPGFAHGQYVTPGNERNWEVHLKNRTSTLAATNDLYGQGDDRSQGEMTFQNANGLPWAILINDTWRHPKEKHLLNMAYPQFVPFAKKGGDPELDWSATKDDRYVVQD